MKTRGDEFFFGLKLWFLSRDLLNMQRNAFLWIGDKHFQNRHFSEAAAAEMDKQILSTELL